MTLIEHFQAMARNNRWSNYRLHWACAKLTESDYRAARVSFFPSIYLTLNHIHAVDLFYIEALEKGGRGAAVWKEVEIDQLPDLTARQEQADARLIAFCDSLTEATLGAELLLDRGDGKSPSERVEAVLPHLFTHQIHHRGQVHAMLSGTSVPPPQLDEFFLDWDLPLREKDLSVLNLAEPMTIGRGENK
jgi:uncharacterized damage-inducible protein DinB